MAVRTITKTSAFAALAAALAALAAPQTALAAPDGLENGARAERGRGGGEGGWRGNRGQEGGGWSRPAAPAPQADNSGWRGQRGAGGWARPEASAPAPVPQADNSGWRGNRGSWARPARVEQRAQAPVQAQPQARSWSDGEGRGNWRGNDGGWSRPGASATTAGTVQNDRRDWRGNDSRREDMRRERREDWRDNNNRSGWNNRQAYRGNDSRYNGGDSRYRDDDRRDNRWQNNNRHGYSGDHRRWNNDWRRDRRYDWYSYRNHNRNVYRLGSYYAPYRGYYYRPLSIGFYLDSLFFSSRYMISDPWQYRLPDAYGPYRWVRYYDDALLVNIYSGEVVDVIRNFFW